MEPQTIPALLGITKDSFLSRTQTKKSNCGSKSGNKHEGEGYGWENALFLHSGDVMRCELESVVQYSY